jgi:hypothetical protein
MITAISSFGKVEGMESTSPTLGFTMSAGYGDTETDKDFIDMNGDGLPDRVWRTDDGLMVRLNRGYDLGPARQWSNTARVRLNKTANVGAGASFSAGMGGWGGGLGLSLSQSGVQDDYIDMNGDGLPDRVVKKLVQIPGYGIKAMRQHLQVYLNTGRGFAGTPIRWRGSDLDLPITYDATMCFNASLC